MRAVLMTLAVLGELFLWFSLGYTYDSIERLVQQIVLFSGLAILVFSLLVPVFAESDAASGERNTKAKLEKYSERALMVFIVAIFGQVWIAYLINLFISVFITGDYFSR